MGLATADSPRRLTPYAVGALAVGHLIAGVALIPRWMFSKYPDGAALLAQGRLRPEEGADMSPLYLLLNAALPPSGVRALQAVFGAAAVCMLYAIGSRLRSRSAGLVAAALFAVASPILLYEATLEPDLLVTVLGVAALLFLVLWDGDGRPWTCVAAGGAVGLSVALRPSAVPFALLVIAWLAWRPTGSPPGVRFRPAALFAVGALAAILLPLGVVRLRLGPSLAATMSAGQVLHQGNRPESTGVGAQVPQLIKLIELQERSPEKPDYTHALYRRLARAAESDALSSNACEAYWAERTAAYAVRHPLDFALRLPQKLAFFTFGPPAHDLAEVTRAQRSLPPYLFFRLDALGLLGLAGAAACLLLRWRAAWVFIYAGGALAVVLVFYVTSRYRLPIAPAWCLFGAFYLDAAARSWRDKRTVAILGLSALFVFAIWTASGGVRDASRLIERGGDASALSAALENARVSGDLAAATRIFADTQAAQPFTLLTRNLRGIPTDDPRLAAQSMRTAEAAYGKATKADALLLAVLLQRAGRCDAAIALANGLEVARYRTSVFDRSVDPALVSMECLLSKGDRTGAFGHAVRSLENRAGTLDGLASAIAGASAQPDLAAGRLAGWEDELRQLHDPLSAHYALSRARNLWGDYDAALKDADFVLAKLPEAAVARYERARALAGLGRDGEAAREYEATLKAFPSHAWPTEPFDALVGRTIDALDHAPDGLWLAIEHSVRKGRFDQARALAARAPELWPAGVPPDVEAERAYLATVRSEPEQALGE